MNDYFKLNNKQQKLLITQTSVKIGLPVHSIEKDLWVSVILQIIFTLPIAEKLLFKGGTSLSKAYKLINRFSEDIDLAMDRSLFGMEGNLTKKQIKELRKNSSLFVRDNFCNQLLSKIKEYELDNLLTIEAEENGVGDFTYPEPRKIHIRYKSLFDNYQNYLLPEVVLEIGARSLIEPTDKTMIKSMVEEVFDQIDTDIVGNVNIITAIPQKTFLEKAFLLHELFVTKNGAIANRRTRHMYDLYMLMQNKDILSAIKNDELWSNISQHRQLFTSVKGVDYSEDIRKNIHLIPPEEFMVQWQKDYKQMQESMIYGYSPSFDELISKITSLQEIFKTAKN